MKLSVVIASYNTKSILETTIALLQKQLRAQYATTDYEIIIIDNNSTDGSKEWLATKKNLVLIQNKENVGFARANNQGIDRAKGNYVLLLNSDVHLESPVDFKKLIIFLEKDVTRAGLTIKLMVSPTKMDAACHRGFPTPGNSLLYFSKLEKIVGGTYHLTKLPLTTIHEIDCPSAAFFLVKRSVLEAVHGFDAAFFFYAEDIDLCYRIKQEGYSLWFYPDYTALHLKYQSGKQAKTLDAARRSKYWFYKSMSMYYEKNEAKKHNGVVNTIVRSAIKVATQLYK